VVSDGPRGTVVRRMRAALVLLGTLILIALLAAPAARASTAHVTTGPWALTGFRSIPAAHSDQGLATVAQLHGGQRVVLRGNADVPAYLRARGWWHIGDPDSRYGYLLDAYQGTPSMRAKLFVLTSPDGHRSEWFHRLAPGEMINNSWVAIAPSGRWFLAGEWHSVHRLLQFPMPVLNSAVRPGRDLPLTGTIRLVRPVRNVQGCSFASATRLVCSTNDTGDELFGVSHELIAIDLAHALDGRSQTGVPVLLGQLPQVSGCGTAETEGIDVHGSRMLVVAHEPGRCSDRTLLFTYRLRSAAPAPPASPAPAATQTDLDR
jgi:hypothetical protein